MANGGKGSCIFSFSRVSFKASKLWKRPKRTQIQILHPIYMYSICIVWYLNTSTIHGSKQCSAAKKHICCVMLCTFLNTFSQKQLQHQPSPLTTQSLPFFGSKDKSKQRRFWFIIPLEHLQYEDDDESCL